MDPALKKLSYTESIVHKNMARTLLACENKSASLVKQQIQGVIGEIDEYVKLCWDAKVRKNRVNVRLVYTKEAYLRSLTEVYWKQSTFSETNLAFTCRIGQIHWYTPILAENCDLDGIKCSMLEFYFQVIPIFWKINLDPVKRWKNLFFFRMVNDTFDWPLVCSDPD